MISEATLKILEKYQSLMLNSELKMEICLSHNLD